MSNDSNTKDPRIEAGAKAWDKHMGGRYSPHEVDELSEEVALILAAADAVDPRKPRTITTVEELDALPVEAVVRSDMGNVYIKDHDLDNPTDMWWVAGGGVSEYQSNRILLPATVLHEPGAEATR